MEGERMAEKGKVRTKLLHCSKNEARVSYGLESGLKLLSKLGEIVALRCSALYSFQTFAGQGELLLPEQTKKII